MALPTLEKTWQFGPSNSLVNQFLPALASGQANYRAVVLAIKNTLKGFTTNPWVVRGSSNSVTAAAVGDGVDRLIALTDWVSAINDSTARSWIVLRQPALGNGELLIEARNAGASPGERSIRTFWSASGLFTGGSTTARPTATDEVVLINIADFVSASGTSPFQTVVHGMQSSDGETTRIIFYNGGNATGFWSFERLGSPVSGLTLPVQVGCRYNSPGALLNTQTTQISVGTLPFVCSQGGVSFTSGWSSFGYGNALAPANAQQAATLKNGFDGSYPFFEIKAFGDAPPTNGILGRVRDLWMGSTALVEGRTYPNDSSYQFVQFGNVIFPWCGVLPLIQ